MSEKIKGMFGDPERAEEVREWLLSQGAINDTQMKCDDVHSIYYVDNSKMKTLFSLHGAYDALFDIVKLPKPQHEFKPFEKVLVRDNAEDVWTPSLYGLYTENSSYPHFVIGGSWKLCIPYEGNEHLIGTTKNPEEE